MQDNVWNAFTSLEDIPIDLETKTVVGRSVLILGKWKVNAAPRLSVIYWYPAETEVFKKANFPVTANDKLDVIWFVDGFTPVASLDGPAATEWIAWMSVPWLLDCTLVGELEDALGCSEY